MKTKHTRLVVQAIFFTFYLFIIIFFSPNGLCRFIAYIIILGWSRGARYQRGTWRSWPACMYVAQYTQTYIILQQ